MLRFLNHLKPEVFEHERKFVLPTELIHETERRLRYNPAFFREINMPIRVKSCYFDTLDLGYYWGNVDGMGRRLKVMVRSYATSNQDTEVLPELLTSPRLEYKVKMNTQRTKIAHGCPHGDAMPTFDALWRHLQQCASMPAIMREHLMTLHPTAVIDYHRRYFRSLDGTLRLTVDTDIIYSSPNANRRVKVETSVLELKYARSAEASATRAAEHLRLRISRNSKYINAMNALGQSL